MNLLKWSLLQLRNTKKASLFLVINFTLGFLGFTIVESFKGGVSANIKEQSQALMAGDISVFARKQINVEFEKQNLAGISNIDQVSRSIEMFSMVKSVDTSRLVQIKAIDVNYPLYGKLQLNTKTGRGEDIGKCDCVWVNSELLTQLNAKVGDRIHLGSAEFTIDDEIKEDPTQGLRFGSVAPRVYMSMGDLPKTQLIQPGSTLLDTYLFKLRDVVRLEETKRKLSELLLDNSIQIQDSIESGEQSAQTITYLNDFLGLVSLVALFLSAVGSTFLLDQFMADQQKNITIYHVLGLSTTRSLIMVSLQFVLISLVAGVTAWLMGSFINPVLLQLIDSLFPMKISLANPITHFYKMMTLSLVVIIALGLPLFAKYKKLSVPSLFSDFQLSQSLSLFQLRDRILYYLPALILFYLLAVYQAHTMKMANLFCLGLFGSLGIIYLLFFLVVKSLSSFSFKLSWPVRFALQSLLRKTSSTVSVIIAISLGTLLIVMSPLIRDTIKEEIKNPESLKLPSLFLFDIQDEQKELVKKALADNNAEILFFSPMVRAKLLKVNEQSYEIVLDENTGYSREQENKARARNRGVNLSYKKELNESEQLASGKWNDQSWDHVSVPEVSVEEKWADRMDLKLGDLLTFDVQGVEIQGIVTSFRKVRWNSFQPNFFLVLQSGVLEEAPQTYLSSIKKLPGPAKSAIQNQLVSEFPNVSIVDVDSAVEKLIALTEKLSVSLELMAYLSIFIGLIILISINQQSLQQKKWDYNLIKIIGADQRSILKSSLYESIAVSFFSVFLGISLSLVVSSLLTIYLFDRGLVIHWLFLAELFVFITFLLVITTFIMTNKLILSRPTLK